MRTVSRGGSPDGSRLAVVVPTLDEEAALARNLAAVLALGAELVVSDGGSADGTVELARSLGVRVVAGAPGRGAQLNRGAAATAAEVLLFLHADTALPPAAAGQIHGAVAAGFCGGGFQVRFDGGGRLMRMGSRLVNLRTRLTRLPLGDQAQFVTRRAFADLGGYREWPILEDLDFMRRLKRHGRVAVLPGRVSTSARRFVARGIATTVATNWLIWGLYFAGVSPHRLAALYRKIR